MSNNPFGVEHELSKGVGSALRTVGDHLRKPSSTAYGMSGVTALGVAGVYHQKNKKIKALKTKNAQLVQTAGGNS